jgi:subtilisin-like proprotein convertase family protein
MKQVLSALFFLASAIAQAQTSGLQTVSYQYNGQPPGIPSSNTGVGALAEIYVPAGLTVASVTVQVQITYPRVGDLVVYLYSERGTRTILLNHDCGNLQNVNTTFDDASASKFSDFCPAEPGRGPFRADEPLSNSKGEFSAGYWQLFVQNTGSSTNSRIL